MKMYWATFVMRLKLETQYRAAALGGLVTQLFFGLISVFLYRALLNTSADAAAMQATATYVWIQQAFFRMIFSTDNTLTSTILKGDMAYQLVRPVDQYSFWFARTMAAKLSGTLMRAVPLLLIVIWLPRGIGLGAPASLPALLGALVALLLGFLTITAISSFSDGLVLLTLDNRGINAVLSFLISFFSGNLLPLTLFPDSWQRLISCLPFSQILDTPIRLYTGQYALTVLPQLLLMQIMWIAVFVIVGRLLWRGTLRRIIVQGG